MRKEYGKALRSLFTARMKAELPRFEETRVSSMYFWPGHRAFRWKASEQIHCWIVLSPSPKDLDEFTLLIGWSTLGRYPELSMVPCAELPSDSRDEFRFDEYLTRLPFLWSDRDTWWKVPTPGRPGSMAALQARPEPVPADKAREAVAHLVDDAIERLKAHAIPYLEEFFSSRRSAV